MILTLTLRLCLLGMSAENKDWVESVSFWKRPTVVQIRYWGSVQCLT